MDGFVSSWLTPAFIGAVLIVAVCVFSGLRRGFVKTAYDMCGILFGVILTVLISPAVASLMKNNVKIYDSIHSRIEEHVSVNFNLSDNKLVDYINESSLPDKVGDFLLEGGKSITDAAQGSIEKVNDKMADKLTDMVINGIAFIITLIVVLILLAVAFFLLDLVSKLPVINGLNKTLGIAAGIVEAYIILSILGVVIMAISTTQLGIALSEQIAANPILSFIYQYNLIIMGITKVKGLRK